MTQDNIEKQPPVPPFVRFVCSAVPMVFDDSLSYYEALCALWKYLQDTVDVINNNATVTEEYIQLTKDMKEYMDNYFDNLDVQEEINNKLDAMVDDGTLQEIITTYIQSNVAWTFDTVADMKDASNLVAGSYARTLGFHTINDGGGATYYISDTGTANEMDVIAVGSLYANLVNDKQLTVKQFGAYGDNTHDDINYFERCLSITNNIICKHGDIYLIGDTIDIDNKNDVIFDGKGSKIHFTGENKQLIRLHDTCFNITIQNMESYGDIDNDTPSYYQAFMLNESDSNNDFANIKVCNNKVHNYSDGIIVNTNLLGNMHNIEIDNNEVYDIFVTEAGYGYGIHLANGNGCNVNGIVKNNNVYRCSRHLIYIGRGSNYTIENNYIHDNHITSYNNYWPALNCSRSKNISIKGNIFENNKDTSIYFSSELQPDEEYALDSYMCENFEISNNKFYGYDAMPIITFGYAQSEMAHVKNINIIDNAFYDTAEIRVYSAENVLIDNNYFEPLHAVQAVTYYGGNPETESLYTHNIRTSNNHHKTISTSARPYRLNPVVLSHDAELTFEANTLDYYTKYFITPQNASNNKIKVINQKFDNDFYFASGYHFDSVYINGVDITA